MTSKGLRILGQVARSMRSARLGFLLQTMVDGVDAILTRLGLPLLSANVGPARLWGFARHRSFLEHLAGGTYEPYTLELFSAAIEPGALVADGGAHIGLFSVTACLRMDGAGTLISIEADPYNFRALEINLRRNGCRNARTHCAAIWETEGERVFFVSRGTIGSSLAVRPDVGKAKTIHSPTLSLDAVTRDIPSAPVVVKLDVEGAEIEALRGMTALLRRAPRAVVLAEANPGAQAEAGHSDSVLIGTLRALGFAVSFVDEAGRRLIDVGEHSPRKGMLYCTRPPEER
jgi:FkbM family methyltransferase